MTEAPGAAASGDDLGATLDHLAARAWPAAEVQMHDGWWLRFNDGLHRRVNSVFPERDGTTALDERIRAAEAFYRENDLPPRFQISPACRPADLDAILEARGYVPESGVDIMIADAEPLAALDGGPAAVRLEPALSDDWLDVHMADAADPETKRRKGAMLERIGPPHVFAAALQGGRCVAAGLAIAGDGWFGVFGMYTLAAARRQGHARTLLTAMAGWALAQGVPRAYLQVERDNPGALSVYCRAGFETVHGYHYRTLWNGADG